jgi:hypothetical protein
VALRDPSLFLLFILHPSAFILPPDLPQHRG